MNTKKRVWYRAIWSFTVEGYIDVPWNMKRAEYEKMVEEDAWENMPEVVENFLLCKRRDAIGPRIKIKTTSSEEEWSPVF